ncbi:MAG: hypothetical protein ACTSQP_04705 [Promethearchaeota archaeon]
MKDKDTKKPRKTSINLILFSISMIIFGSLGLTLITQMEIINGWSWDKYTETPFELKMQRFEDVNGDGVDDIIVNIYQEYKSWKDDKEDKLDFGAVVLLNGKNGSIIWENEYDNPVIKLYQINDVNKDNFKDLLVCKGVAECFEDDSLKLKRNSFENFILSGKDGKRLDNVSSYTNNFLKNVVVLNDYNDDLEDLIFLEVNYSSTLDTYLYYVKGYYINGTLKESLLLPDTADGYLFLIQCPGIHLLDYDNKPQLFLIGSNYFGLINLSASNYSFSKMIYFNNTGFDLLNFKVIEDFNSDKTSEILIFTREKILLINGKNGKLINSIEINEQNVEFAKIINSDRSNNNELYLFIYSRGSSDWNLHYYSIYKITTNNIENIWKKEIDSDTGTILPINHDFDDDGINDLISVETIQTTLGTQEVHRYIIRSSLNYEKEFGIINFERGPNSFERYFLLGDIDKDNIENLFFTDGGSIFSLNIQDPVPLFLSPYIPLGFPLFILLLVILILGLIFLFIKIRQLQFNIKEGYKRSRFSFIIISIFIALIGITFGLFLGVLNIFNSTLLLNYSMTIMILSFLIISILWFALLPFTAAIYNKFAPNFAFLFIRLRNLMFKITKAYHHEIIVLDLGDKTELGNINKIKRVILPTLLSIAIGFYIYNTLAPILGYPQSFDTFGGNEFFQFLVGYLWLCTIPMIFTFLVFSFLISGNYLLDDAGIVYFAEPKRHRKPGDIEPISIWALSFIKGMAGMSALITFGMFFLNVDFSGFFTNENVAFNIFGTFVVVTLFWGLPFITSFTYILLAIEVMDSQKEWNCEKLYKIMEKHGYDTTPHALTNLFPEGYKPKEENEKEIEKEKKKKKKEKEKKKRKKKEKSQKDKNTKLKDDKIDKKAELEEKKRNLISKERTSRENKKN